ncbi:MAG: hypothetical protein M1812_005118 [Candelaria pacifica]|nr:MAG: hypothetical protein M1812_005118 [Candelaria pacifica]
MAYDQHTQYQPPPRAYYSRPNPQQAPTEVYSYDQYPNDYGYGANEYGSSHDGARGNQIPDGYHGEMNGYARQQGPQQGYAASNEYHGADRSFLNGKHERLGAGNSNLQPVRPDRIVGGSRGAQAEEVIGIPRSQLVDLQGRSRSRQPNNRIPLPASPQKTSWDNPFPTFPNIKQKAQEGQGGKLHENVAAISLENRPRKSNDLRPERPGLEASKGSYSSSRSQERPQGALQNYSKGQQSRGLHLDRAAKQQSNTERSLDAYTHDYQHKVAQGSGPVYHERFQRQNAYTALARPCDPPLEAGPTFSSHAANGALLQSPQRSMTMPAELAGGKPSPRPQVEYSDQNSWQEPGPTAGYHGPEGTAFVPPRPATAGGSRPTPGARARSDDARRENIPRPAAIPYDGVNHDHANRAATAPSGRSTPHSKQESVGEVLDSYYETSNDDYAVPGNKQDYSESMEEEMPNFEAATTASSTHRRGLTIDQHLKPRLNAIGAPPLPSYKGRSNMATIAAQAPRPVGQTSRSTSHPDLRGSSQVGQNGASRAVFEMVGDVPEVPPLPHSISSPGSQQPARKSPGTGQYPQPSQHGLGAAGYGHSRSGSNGSAQTRGYGGSAQRQRLPPPQRNGSAESYHSTSDYSGFHHRPAVGPVRQLSADTQWSDPGQRGVSSRGTPSPANQAGPRSSPSTGRPKNPDALPAHPTPVRAGLIPDSVASQAIKSPPVRQYNGVGTTTQPQSHSQQHGTSSATPEKRQSVPVTHEDLERLKRTVKANPSDSKTQLLLAQKWVEAATVLADEGGRADTRTRNKNRERYIFDAHKIVKKLVSNGNPDAMFYLADCTGRGLLGLESDTKEAFNLYQSAAKAGHAQSAYRTAVCCEMGQEEGGGTRRDPVKAVQWYKRAATLGDTPAMYKMGMILLKGLLGQPRNPREAVTWLKRAADRADVENPHALHELGLLYEAANDNDAILRDEQYSKQLFTEAADLGYKFSQFRLGCAYEYGLMGCRIDPRQSIAWYSRAAVQEEHQSELALSGWYLTGSEGVLQQSDTEAYLWARKAAQAGLAKAEYAMGYFTEVGIGAPSNIADAQRWYQRAAIQHYPKARERLDALRNGGANSQKSRERISRSKVSKQNEGECIVM